jgi:thioredoxin-related protein
MRKALVPLAVFLSVLILLACGRGHKTPADIKGTIAWLDPGSALPVFPFGNNPIYFYVNSPESRVCRAMEERVFSRPEIIEFMNKHVTSISITPDSIDTVIFMGRSFTSEELLTNLKVEGYPTHFFFDKTGQLKGVRDGYIGLIEFKHLLKYLSEGYIDKIDFQSYLRLHEGELDTIWGEF